MTEENIRVTLEFLDRKRKVTFDITEEDFHKKTLSKAFIDFTIEHAMKSAIPSVSTPIEVKTNTVTIIEIPSRIELETFIKSQPDYEYSFDTLINHFVGNNRSRLNETEFGNWENAVRMKVKRITQSIAELEKGHWEDRQIGGHKKVFKFIKDNGGEIKQSTQTQQEDLTKLLA